MSFWDDLSQAAEGLGQVGFGNIGVAWGVAQAANDAMHAKDLGSGLSTFMSEAQQKSSQYGPVGGIGKVGDHTGLTPAYNWTTDKISRSIATPGLAMLDSRGTYNPDSWIDAWNRAGDQQISGGQILPGVAHDIVTNFNGSNPGSAVLTGGDENAAAREQFFHNTWYGKGSSGALDAAISWNLDPLAVGGKLLKANREAAVTVKKADVEGAIMLLRGDMGHAAATVEERKAATRLGSLLTGTDNMTFDQMMNHPAFKGHTDTAVLASLFDKANQIADPAARLSVKSDIYGTLLGDQASMERIQGRQDDLTAQMDRFLKPAEGTNGQTFFSFGDHGQGEITFFNSPQAAKEMLARQDAIAAEADRLARLWDAPKTDRVGATLGERIGANMRGGIRESVILDGEGSRPIRVLYGATNARISGHIDTNDVSRGYEDLTNMLARDQHMPSDQKVQLLDQFGQADNKGARAVVVWRAEASMYKAAAQAYGLTPDEVKALHGLTTGVRMKWRSALETRAYSAANPVIIGDDGEAIAFSGPWIIPQLQSTVPFTDPKALESVLKFNQQSRWIESMAKQYLGMDTINAAKVNNFAENTWDIGTAAAGLLMRPWKFAALFRAAFPFRVQVDTQFRNVSSLGPMLYALTAKEGTINLLKNTVTKGMNPEYYDKLNDFVETNHALHAKMKAARALPEGDVKAARIEELMRQSDLNEAEMQKVSQFTRRGNSETRATVLKNPEQYRGFDVTPARDDMEYAIIKRKLDDSGTMSSLMSDMSSAEIHAKTAAGGFDIIGPNDVNWNPSMIRNVNQQFRNSPTFMAALTRDHEQLTDWIRSNPTEYNNFKHVFAEPENYASYVHSNVNHYLPSEEIQQVVSQRDITKGDLDRWFPNAADKPTIHGEAYGPGAVGNVNAFVVRSKQLMEKWYKFASDAPEQVMGRHPLYNQRFRDHMKFQIDRYPDEYLTTDTIDNIRINADRLARKDVADVLFDLTRQSGAAASFRLFSPFFSAWEDTMKKWGKLFYDNPDHAARFLQAWQAPNNAGIVVDSEGYQVHGGKAYDPNTGKQVDASKQGKGEYMVLPNFLGYVGLGQKDWQLKIRKDSFNIVFQGDPAWLPGAGPLAEVPVNELAKRTRLATQVQSNPVLKYLLPYGISNESVLSQVSPAWVRQLEHNRPDTQAYADQYALFLAGEMSKWRAGERPDKPSGDEVSGMVNNYFIMRSILSNAAPVSVAPGISPKLQFFVDQAHMLRNEYYADQATFKANNGGKDWQQVFYDKWPDYFDLTVDLSSNTTGIIASDQAWDAAKKYAPEIAKNPELGWMFVGADNAGTFDPNVRTAQLANSIGYGTAKTWRTRKDPNDAIKQIETERGWIQYNQMTTALNLALEQRDPSGKKTLQSKGNEDLKALKQQYVASLANGNQSWMQAYLQRDDSKVDTLIGAAQDAWKANPSLANRPDMQNLKLYIAGREAIRSILQQRSKHSLTATENQDIAEVWSSFTSSLVQSDVGFERMFSRVLEGDNLNRELMGING